jgi:hypothetical protein
MGRSRSDRRHRLRHGGPAKILIAHQERASRVMPPEQLDRLAGRPSGDVVLLLELVLQRDRPTDGDQVGRIISGDYDTSGAEDSSQANG